MSDFYSKKWLAFAGIALLSFGCYLDYTVVNVALPTHAFLHIQWFLQLPYLDVFFLAQTSPFVDKV